MSRIAIPAAILSFAIAYMSVTAEPPRTNEWPQFHGPRRDNKSDETGLLRQWPSGGPSLLWTAKGIGHGFSSVAIAGGLIYTAGNIGPDTVVTALDLDGKVQWQVKNGPAWNRAHPGARGTPTIDGDRLYHEGGDGDIVCLEARTGKLVWSLNILQKFNGRNVQWGKAESLLIDGDRVICVPGGENAGVVALNKNTGETVWICRDISEKPGYASPILVDYKGVRQIVTMMARSIVGVNPETGALLWQCAHVTPWDENTMTPVFHDGCIFLSTRTTGARLLRLTVEGEKVSAQEVWHTKRMDNQHGGVILVDGCIYGDCLSGGRPWVCLDFATGEVKFAGPGIGRCAPTYADGMLYLLNHDRTAALVRPTPTSFDVVSQFIIPEGGDGPSWAHPVVCGGRLYIRYSEFLYCYDIRAE